MSRLLWTTLLVFVTLASAEGWKRTHYVSIGAGATISQGDLEGVKKETIKTDESVETVYAPNLGIYLMPELEIGAEFNQHTIFLDLSFCSPTTNYGKESEEGDETSTDIARIGLGYRYNFFWPEAFQIFAGIGYSFMYLSTEGNAYLKKDGNTSRSDGVLMGNGFAGDVGTLYYLTRHVTMEMHIRLRTMFFASVGTDENGFTDLSDSYTQTSEELALKFAYHF